MSDNKAERIAELRRRIAANKGKANRARRTQGILASKIQQCESQIYNDRQEIRELGGQ